VLLVSYKTIAFVSDCDNVLFFNDGTIVRSVHIENYAEMTCLVALRLCLIMNFNKTLNVLLTRNNSVSYTDRRQTVAVRRVSRLCSWSHCLQRRATDCWGRYTSCHWTRRRIVLRRPFM